MNYPSSKRIAADSLYNWDPRPQELRKFDTNLCNQFIFDLRENSAVSGKISMWETSLSYQYDDFKVEDGDKQIVITQVKPFEDNISYHTKIFCGKEYASQVPGTTLQSSSEKWIAERWCRITTSDSKLLFG